MAISINNVDLRLNALVDPTRRNLVNIPDVLEKTQITTDGRLKSVFHLFEQTLDGFNLSKGIRIISIFGGLLPEYKYGLVIKKVEPGRSDFYPGDACIFEFEINEETGFNEIRWGQGRHSDEERFFHGSDHYKYAQKPRTIGWLKGEFGKFLEEALPTVAKWDEEITQNEFWAANKDKGELPPWWTQRAVASLAKQGAETIELDGELEDADTVQQFADKKMIKAVRLGPDAFELVSV